MKQVNGTGSIVSGLAIMCACACAECIPALVGFILLAIGGVVWDRLRGNFVEIKKCPDVVGHGRDKTKIISNTVYRKAGRMSRVIRGGERG